MAVTYSKEQKQKLYAIALDALSMYDVDNSSMLKLVNSLTGSIVSDAITGKDVLQVTLTKSSITGIADAVSKNLKIEYSTANKLKNPSEFNGLLSLLKNTQELIKIYKNTTNPGRLDINKKTPLNKSPNSSLADVQGSNQALDIIRSNTVKPPVVIAPTLNTPNSSLADIKGSTQEVDLIRDDVESKMSIDGVTENGKKDLKNILDGVLERVCKAPTPSSVPVTQPIQDSTKVKQTNTTSVLDKIVLGVGAAFVALDAIKKLLTKKPATPVPKPEVPKPATPVPKPATPVPKPVKPEVPKPATPVPKPEVPKPATPVPKPEVPKPATPVPKPEVPKPVPKPEVPKPVTPVPKPKSPSVPAPKPAKVPTLGDVIPEIKVPKPAVKTAGKDAAKAGGKVLGKKIPYGVGALIAAGLATDRAIAGDWAGAGLEIASGAAGIIPGVGTALSLGIDEKIRERDIEREASNVTTKPGQTVNMPEVPVSNSTDTKEIPTITIKKQRTPKPVPSSATNTPTAEKQTSPETINNKLKATKENASSLSVLTKDVLNTLDECTGKIDKVNKNLTQTTSLQLQNTKKIADTATNTVSENAQSYSDTKISPQSNKQKSFTSEIIDILPENKFTNKLKRFDKARQDFTGTKEKIKQKVKNRALSGVKNVLNSFQNKSGIIDNLTSNIGVDRNSLLEQGTPLTTKKPTNIPSSVTQNVLEEVAEKPITKLPSKPLSKATEKGVSKVLTKTAGNSLTKTAGKSLAKTAGKSLAKTAGKSLLKKIPGIGALAGLGFAANRLFSGDISGAGLELASGLASTVPGIGTAGSVGIDAMLAAKDMAATQPSVEQTDDTTKAPSSITSSNGLSIQPLKENSLSKPLQLSSNDGVIATSLSKESKVETQNLAKTEDKQLPVLRDILKTSGSNNDQLNRLADAIFKLAQTALNQSSSTPTIINQQIPVQQPQRHSTSQIANSNVDPIRAIRSRFGV